ncbi:MAG: hypothetical protein KIS73_28120 [Enhydrobacter sp.]|nr:hypothetical protein [Enhydrobacter sp.]
MSRKPETIPNFNSEAEERRFWETHDSSGLVDWSKAERVRFPNLKPSTTSAPGDAATPPVSSRAQRGT